MSLRHRGFGSACLANVCKKDINVDKAVLRECCSVLQNYSWDDTESLSNPLLYYYNMEFPYYTGYEWSASASSLAFISEQGNIADIICQSQAYFFAVVVKFVVKISISVIHSGNDLCLWCKTVVLPQGAVTDSQESAFYFIFL